MDPCAPAWKGDVPISLRRTRRVVRPMGYWLSLVMLLIGCQSPSVPANTQTVVTDAPASLTAPMSGLGPATARSSPAPTPSPVTQVDLASGPTLGWATTSGDPADPGPPSHFVTASFVSDDVGWALGSVPSQDGYGRSAYALGLTRDGGQHWETRTLPDRGIACLDGVVDILFLDDMNGWLRCSGLLATADGGLTWTVLSTRDPIRAWGRTRTGLVWAWIRDVDLGAVVMAPRPGGLVDWRPLVNDWPNQAGPDPEQPRTAIAVLDETTLVFRDPLAFGGQTSDGPWWATHDGGATWQSLAPPCGRQGWPFEAVAVVSGSDFRAACGGAGATSMQTKRFSTSSDGGMNWAITGEAAWPGYAPAADLLPGQFLPLSGHLWGIQAPSPTLIVAYLSRSTAPLLSADGGMTWTRPDLGLCAVPDDGVQGTFVSAERGWLWNRGGLMRTGDGGQTWECFLFPRP